MRVGTFGTVVIVLALVAVVVAALSYWGSGRIYGGLGKGGLGMDHDERPPSAVAGPQSAEAQEEIRQMLEAKSARREARGEAPLDERRARQGKEPLDVEAEVDRELRDLRG